MSEARRSSRNLLEWMFWNSAICHQLAQCATCGITFQVFNQKQTVPEEFNNKNKNFPFMSTDSRVIFARHDSHGALGQVN